MERSSNRPTKRLRLQGPDGFQVTKNISKPAYKPPPPFVSSFDSPKAGPSTKVPDDEQEKSKDSSRVRERPQNPFTAALPDFGDISLGREANLKGKGKEKEKEISVRPAGNRKRPNPFITASNAGADPSRVRLTVTPSESASVHLPPISHPKPHSAPLRPLQPLKPPSFVINPPANASSSKPVSILKPPPRPQLTSKAIVLKPLAPPNFAPFAEKKSLTNLKPISSFAINPTKDGAGAELLSLFLQQHGHNFVTPFEREMQRGIGLSPRKNKSAKAKFVRGGMAARAQHLISGTKTDYTLWCLQLKQKLSSAPPAAPTLSCDLLLRILRVLPLPTKTATPTRVHLATCRISSRHRFANITDLRDQCYVVLFPHVVEPSRNFEEGRDVLAWMPWYKVLLSTIVPREILGSLSVEPLMPPRSVIIVPRWHIMQTE
ncbi:uncharacterized protein F5891DRAFT_1152386 [Suillus fuscotomentosus]|uniref:Uncharacterized protein n=1 Tax=Suillus fuscotomentosus TaxID=1912939 RepID=A0AAD4DV86_9AGAM|nr:uncharacterized protein F5891DRAFT_1152386 [Suillus fuscotomentosus]KAG1894427.1 hypothetical protein F5891DRAFT_1152386 [Suillus fuscotomentosus]